MRRLALFADGTWNDPSDRTNVWKLQQATVNDGVKQVVKYIEGVGTKFFERFRGGALGKGLSRNVREAYEWLADEYEDGDQIFLFGFSRGAYTVRTLAGLIARCGLRHHDSKMTVEDIWDRYRKGKDATPIHEIGFAVKRGDKLSADEQLLWDSSRRVDIEFIGVWDTVGALGVPFGRIRGLSRATYGFHNTFPSTLYKGMYHAVAIDEHRKAFDATLWTGFQAEGAPFEPLNDDQTLEQRWFVGDHGDVGGSGSLATIPLAWIQQKAIDHGLDFARLITPDKGAVDKEHGDSFASFGLGLYRLVKLNIRHRREIGRTPRRTRTRPGWSHVINESIDSSVFERWRSDKKYRPRNLSDWAAGYGKSPDSIEGTVFCREA